MPEIGTSGLMSGDGKRGSRYRARPRLYSADQPALWQLDLGLWGWRGAQLLVAQVTARFRWFGGVAGMGFSWRHGRVG